MRGIGGTRKTQETSDEGVFDIAVGCIRVGGGLFRTMWAAKCEC